MIRESPIAGSWYAGTRESLSDQIELCFTNTKFGPGTLPNRINHEPVDDSALFGVIVPHAGYMYSGTTAAHSYLALYKHKPELETAIILGPNHRGTGPVISVSDATAWKTPLGEAGVDQDFVKYLQEQTPNKIRNILEIEDTAHAQEHSIDIQVPFLQYLYGNVLEILPICLKDQSFDTTQQLADILHDLISSTQDKSIAIIASTDLSHEYDYRRVEKNDAKIIDAIATGDIDRFHHTKQDTGITMCGYGSVYTLFHLQSKLGNEKPLSILSSTHSGKVTGDTSGYCVGYLAAKTSTENQ